MQWSVFQEKYDPHVCVMYVIRGEEFLALNRNIVSGHKTESCKIRDGELRGL
jgi:hypothetical protein